MSRRSQSYVDAIVAIARGEDALEVVDDELLQVAQAVAKNRDLYDALTNPQLPVTQRLEIVDRVLEAAHPATRTAVALLVSSGRARDIEEVARAVAERSAEERQRAVAEVQVAVPLSKARREKLRKALEAATGMRLELTVLVDPTVLGGVRAKIGDTVIDGSVSRRLDDIRARLGA
ncbi:MAG: ATP synthase F1 subunit delta [Nitriliruptorales bacterium]